LRLGEAVGLTSEEMLQFIHLLPGVRFAVDAYVNFARNKPWIEAVASSLTELFAPSLMEQRIWSFQRHYSWVDKEALRYFVTLSQAFLLTGDASVTDPVCSFSPHHSIIEQAVKEAEKGSQESWVYRNEEDSKLAFKSMFKNR